MSTATTHESGTRSMVMAALGTTRDLMAEIRYIPGDMPKYEHNGEPEVTLAQCSDWRQVHFEDCRVGDAVWVGDPDIWLLCSTVVPL